MKGKLRLIMLAIASLIICSLNKEETTQDLVAKTTSNICNEIRGAQSIYRDISNEIVRTDYQVEFFQQ